MVFIKSSVLWLLANPFIILGDLNARIHGKLYNEILLGPYIYGKGIAFISGKQDIRNFFLETFFFTNIFFRNIINFNKFLIFLFNFDNIYWPNLNPKY